jgi:creatinine amidohydrolase
MPAPPFATLQTLLRIRGAFALFAGMVTNWLADAHHESFWPHHPWPDFAALPKAAKARMPVVLPLHGFADHGLGLPLDAEEAAGGAVLRRAAEILGARRRALLVLPPLRFCLAPYPSAHFGLDAETAGAQMREIVRSVKASGFGRIVFFNTSPWNGELAATVALDTRAELGLRNHVVNLPELGMSFHSAAPREARANAQAAAAGALGLPAKQVRANVKKSAKADVRDADFRPGNFQHPEPLAPDETLDGATVQEMAAMQLARLLAGMSPAAPRGTGCQPVGLEKWHGLPARDSGMRESARAKFTRAGSPCRSKPAPPRAVFPQSCRPRYLPALTAAELAALPNKRRALVIIPAGAIEQHGPHLPVGVDAILAQALLARALPKLPARAAGRVFVAPPVTFGKSNEHGGFAGTITVSAATLRRVLLALAAELRALGFRCIAVLNTHGGNSPVIVCALREIQASLGMRAGMLRPAPPPELSAREAALGIHAGEWETALMLACAPGLVRMDKAVREYPAHPLGGVAWMTRDVSKSGVLGNAPAATPARGKSWLEKAGGELAGRIGELLGRGQASG